MLSLTSEDYFLEEADSNIQANLEDEVVQEALQSGVDLREYSAQVEQELKDVENKSIEDYIRESQNIASLHNQIVNCDQILERMENMLLSFQSDLGNISDEIAGLQNQSLKLNRELVNRQNVKKDLSQFVHDMVIPENMIQTILDVPVTDQEFLNQLLQLEQKITFLKEQSFQDSRSCLDVGDIVEKLKIKAVSKIRDYLLEKINQFKKPLANYQIQQNAMVKFKFYYKFLLANNREVAKEVRSEYLDTMSKVIFSYFKSYSGRLLKLQYDETATRDDLMGLDDSMLRGGAVGFFTRSSIKSKASVFSMGDRAKVLIDPIDAPLIVPHAQQRTDTKFPYEVLFRSEQAAFMENSCREFAFVTEFFHMSGKEAQEAHQLLVSKTSQLLTKSIDQNVQESYDSISLFLCCNLIRTFRSKCNERSINVMDHYWQHVYKILWTRLTNVLQMNIQSIRDCDPMKMKTIEVTGHFITRRYAEYVAGLLSVMESNPDPSLSPFLADLQQVVEQLLFKMAATFSDRKKQLVFLINNYELVLSIISEKSHSASRESDSFKDLQTTSSAEFVEHVLNPHFGDLIKFLQRTEILLQNATEDKTLRAEWTPASALLRNFNSNWKRSLDQINTEVLSYFNDYRNGTKILQQTLTQFVQYYHRFHKIMSHVAFSSHPDRAQLINIHQLMVEVKKYKTNF